MTDLTPETPEQGTPVVTPEQTKPKTKPKAAAKTRVQSSRKAPAPAAAKMPLPVALETVPAAVAAPAKDKSAKKMTPAKEKKVPTKKPKLVRDSFTFPETEYAMFGTLKQRLLTAGREVKKSELLRAGLAALSEMPTENLLQALAGVDRLKPGRPAK